MYYSKCCVPGCKNTRKDAMYILKLHKFPICEKRCRVWLDSINCPSLSSMSMTELSKHNVCHRHFEPRFRTQKSRIIMQAYPTLFTDTEISTGVPSYSVSGKQKFEISESEHNYCRSEHIDHSYAAPKPEEQAPLVTLDTNIMPLPSSEKEINLVPMLTLDTNIMPVKIKTEPLTLDINNMVLATTVTVEILSHPDFV